MKKVININFQGRVIPIEESAYEILKQYVDSLNRYFANEEGKDEIINDIECRIGELFDEILKKGNPCVTDDDVAKIIASMGRPEDFDDDEQKVRSQVSGNANGQQQSTEHKRLFRDENNKVIGGVCSGIANYFGIDPVIMRIIFLVTFLGAGFGFLAYLILWIVTPSSASTVIGSPRKRLFRDTDNKVISGVCSGLAQYFNVSVIVPRILFIVPFLSFVFHSWNWSWWSFPHFLSFSFSPGAFFVYIILWMVIPEAKTAADKLEMKGEKVDLNTIKTTIQNDMEGFGKKAKEWGKEMGEEGKRIGEEIKKTFTGTGKQFVSQAAPAIKKGGSNLGDFIVIIFKIFAYFIIGVVLFAVTVALFGLGIAFTGLTPLQPFIFKNGWEEIFAWGTLLFFIWLPVVGIITWVIRRIAGSRGNRKLLRQSFIALWIIGWACVLLLVACVFNNFKHQNSPTEENIVLSNPKVNKLEFVATPSSYKYHSSRWFKFEPFTNFVDEDTLYVNNVHFRIVKSNTDSFKITVLKFANGNSRKNAENTASLIEYNPVQTDSIVTMPQGIKINKQNKFRNQHVIITVAVPVGKKIKISQDIWDKNSSSRINFWNDDDWNDQWGDEESGWTTNVEYIQTKQGLERTDNNKHEDLNDDDKNNGNSTTDTTHYHYQPQTLDVPKKTVVNKQSYTQNIQHPLLLNDLLFLRFSI